MSELMKAAVVCSECTTGCAYPEYAPAPKRILRRGPARRVYVVITEGRVFTFTDYARAFVFVRRAKRLPSQQGKDVELVLTTTNGSNRRTPSKEG